MTSSFLSFMFFQMTAMQRIAGDFAETKLLNQLSLTHLGRWLKFHICSLEPDRRFSNHVLLQVEIKYNWSSPSSIHSILSNIVCSTFKLSSD